MSTVKHDSFHIIGISVRTTNENNQAMQDIPALWGRFMQEQVATQIPNKIDDEIFCIYTDYVKDHTEPYTTLLGCKVKNLEDVPAGMKGMTFPGGKYQKFTTRGDLTKGAIGQEWGKIWSMNLPRTYTADFEVYGAKAQNPNDAEVDIFIAVN